jgi:hypothetical protein
MLMALSSTNSTTFLVSCLASDAVSSTGISARWSILVCASGVFSEEAFMKLVGVIRELGSRDSGSRGRSKYESPSIVMGIGSRKWL